MQFALRPLFTEDATTSSRHRSPLPSVTRLAASVVAALAMATASCVEAAVLDRDGLTTANDAACWTDPACALPRGGDSAVMTVYAPDGSILAQAFAFGAEQFTQASSNVYYFDPVAVPVDGSLIDLPSALIRPAPSGHLRVLDTVFGIALTPSGPALAFSSDWPAIDENYWPMMFPPGVDRFGCPQSPFNPPGTKVQECADIPNPVPGPDRPRSEFLTIAYDATPYLSADFQAAGYRADLRTTVGSLPGPGTLTLLGLGLAALASSQRRRSARPDA